MSSDPRPAAPDYPAIVGRNLRAARVKAGMKQADLAARTGATQQRLSLIEAGQQNVTLKTMAALAEAVGCDLPSMLVEPNCCPGVRLPMPAPMTLHGSYVRTKLLHGNCGGFGYGPVLS